MPKSRALKRGRPPSLNPKISVTLRLDPDIVAYYRATGDGWQTKINDVLRRTIQKRRIVAHG
jgi:uncharacterized protein (DUF4415 family)